jgi:hypothetical protein
MALVYRSMHAADDGEPLVHPSAKGLGVRLGIDLDADENGNVAPEGLGMSVRPSIDSIPPPFRRGRFIVWEIDTDGLASHLRYVQAAIIDTRPDWRRSA